MDTTFSLPFFSSLPASLLGVFAIISIAIFTWTLYQSLRKEKLEVDTILDNLIWGVLFGLVGGRFFYVLFHLSYYIEQPQEIYRFWLGGFYIEGAFIGSLLYIWTWLFVKKRENRLQWLDSFTHALLTAGVFFLVVGLYPGVSVLEFREVAVYLILFGVTRLLYGLFKEKLFSGFVFYIGGILVGLVGFIHSFIRLDTYVAQVGGFVIAPGHILSILILLVFMVGLVVETRKFISDNN